MYENYDLLFPDQPVVDLYLPLWAKHFVLGNKPAFKWVDHQGKEQCSLTYSQLHASASSIASYLLIPMQRGDTVLILCPPGLEFVETIFGCQRAGLVSVPILPPEPTFSSQEDRHKLIRILQQTAPKAAIAHPAYISAVKGHICGKSRNNEGHDEFNRLADLLKKLTWISLPSFSSPDILNPSDETIINREQSYLGCGAEDLYLIQYTSGATGIPKPTLITAGSAAHNVRAARKAYDLQPSSVIVSWLPQYHDCGLMFLLLTIVSASTCILTSPFIFVNNPMLWLELVTKYKATCTPVPSFALPLVADKYHQAKMKGKSITNLNLQSMRNLIVINEPIYSRVIEDFVEIFSEFGLNASAMAPSYGLAENCTFVSTAWNGSADRDGNNIVTFPPYKRLLPCARLDSQSELEIEVIVVNPETCEKVDAGQEGEIWISSASNAVGYLGNPSLSNEVFRARLKGRSSSNNWDRRFYVRTGDLGLIRGQEEYLYITGRLQEIIKLDGRLVHPHYVETTAFMSCTAALRGGCSVAFEVGIDESNIIRKQMIVVLAELQRAELHEYKESLVLKKICEEIHSAVLKEHGVDVGLVGLVKARSLPKTTSGKIQRWAARMLLLTGQIELVEKVWFGSFISTPMDNLKDVSNKGNILYGCALENLCFNGYCNNHSDTEVCEGCIPDDLKREDHEEGKSLQRILINGKFPSHVSLKSSL